MVKATAAPHPMRMLVCVMCIGISRASYGRYHHYITLNYTANVTAVPLSPDEDVLAADICYGAIDVRALFSAWALMRTVLPYN
jgi:hypothetical protein